MIYTHKVEIKNKEEKVILSGEVKIDLLNWQDRTRKTKEVSYAIDKDGKLVERDYFEQAELSMKAAVERVVEVSIKHEETLINNIEELSFYKEGMEVIRELSGIILNGVSVAKN